MASRVTQAATEAVVQSTASKSRVSQVATEAVVQSTASKSRVSQVAVEVLVIASQNVFPGEPGGAVW